MQIGHLELFVRDVAASRDFYRDVLGFTVTVAQGPELVWLAMGGFEILLRGGPGAEAAGRYEDAPFGIVLYTDDLAETRQRLIERGLLFRGTVDTEKCLVFTDPDGHWFQLVDPEDHG